MEVDIKLEIQAITWSFDQYREEMLVSLAGKIDELSTRFVTRVKERLSGELLNVHSGRLLGSVNATPATVSEGMIGSTISAGGAAAPYGNIQEVGVSHDWRIAPVDKKALRFMLDGKPMFSKFVQHGPLEARPFMEMTAEEMQQQIMTEIETTIRSTLE